MTAALPVNSARTAMGSQGENGVKIKSKTSWGSRVVEQFMQITPIKALANMIGKIVDFFVNYFYPTKKTEILVDDKTSGQNKLLLSKSSSTTSLVSPTPNQKLPRTSSLINLSRPSAKLAEDATSLKARHLEQKARQELETTPSLSDLSTPSEESAENASSLDVKDLHKNTMQELIARHFHRELMQELINKTDLTPRTITVTKPQKNVTWAAIPESKPKSTTPTRIEGTETSEKRKAILARAGRLKTEEQSSTEEPLPSTDGAATSTIAKIEAPSAPVVIASPESPAPMTETVAHETPVSLISSSTSPGTTPQSTKREITAQTTAEKRAALKKQRAEQAKLLKEQAEASKAQEEKAVIITNDENGPDLNLIALTPSSKPSTPVSPASSTSRTTRDERAKQTAGTRAAILQNRRSTVQTAN